ncbi:hypothetical protein GCM10010252_23750 [Streptomyces aureoverticillatus]|nr:hypothetical protein GCM10010252_23750 [Streptomyces aureoverticillatus]
MANPPEPSGKQDGLGRTRLADQSGHPGAGPRLRQGPLRQSRKAWDFWRRNHWYARGTRSASPGLALVGKAGPELIEMRGGERVHSAPDTAALLGARNITVNITAAPDVPTENTILRALERAHLMHGR